MSTGISDNFQQFTSKVRVISGKKPEIMQISP